jgi:AP-4 complex subunit beta-1
MKMSCRLRDVDPSVVANSIMVLNEIMAKSPNGGMAINRAIMLHLLNRIHEFSEFDLVQVLELVPRYIPANAEEGFQIMNLLDPVLRTSSCSAVLATVGAFLSMADQIAESPEETAQMKQQVVGRVKAPLITLVAGGSSEVQYVLLKQIEGLVQLCPGSFDDEFRQFYIRYHEPTHVKYLKIETIPLLANPDTAPDIVNELAEMVFDQNTHLGRLAVRSMAKIACRDTGGPGCAESIAQRMVELLDSNVEYVQSEAATALTLMIRKHEDLKPVASMSLVRTLKYVQEPTGKASIIYLIGECGDIIQEAPYALERLIDSYDTIKDVTVKHQLLNATVKLFFLRPAEVQRMLGRLLHKATDDVTSQDLHDRALLYYRLLRSGADPKSILAPIVQTNHNLGGRDFTEDDDAQLRAELMEEYNTLATVYGKVSANFIRPAFQVVYKKMPPEHPLNGMGGTEGGGHVPVAPQTMPQPASVLTQTPPAGETVAQRPTVPAAANAMVADLLGFDSPVAPPAAAAQESAFALAPGVTMTGDEYQSKWASISDSEAIVSTVSLRSVPSSTDEIEAGLTSISVSTMASGELPAEFKFFLYAKHATSGNFFLIQSNIGKAGEPLMIITVKISGQTLSAEEQQQQVDRLIQEIQRALG